MILALGAWTILALMNLQPDMEGRSCRKLFEALPELTHAGNLACAGCGKARAAEDLYCCRAGRAELRRYEFLCEGCKEAAHVD